MSVKRNDNERLTLMPYAMIPNLEQNSAATDSFRRKRGIAIFGILVFGFLLFMQIVERAGYSFEGAYVTFRYALNLVQNREFTFNPHEPILATTTPLTALFLAPLAWISGEELFPLTAQMFLALIMVVATFINDLILRSLGASFYARLITMILTLVHPEFLKSAASGMETPIVCLMMSAGLLTLLLGNVISCAFIICSLLLVRIDTIPFALALGIELMRSQPRATRGLLIALPIIYAYVGYTFFTFGSPIPQSVLAKSGWFSSEFSRVNHSIWSYVDWLVSGISGTISILDPISVVGILCPVLIGVGCFSLFRSSNGSAKRVFSCWAAFLLTFFLFYVLGRGSIMFAWYLTPVLWVSFIPLGVGVSMMMQWCANSESHTRRIIAVAMILASAIELFVVDSGIASLYTAYVERGAAPLRRIGLFLRVHSPNATVLSDLFGIIGYHCGCRLLEPSGILTKEALTLHTKGMSEEEIFLQLLEEHKPEIVVVRQSELEVKIGRKFPNEIAKAKFLENYSNIQRFLPDGNEPKDQRDAYLLFEKRSF